MKKLLLTILLPLWGLGTFAQGWPANYGGVMLQSFIYEDYTTCNWVNLKDRCDELSKYFDLIWVPQSGYTGGTSMGYNDVYWLDQKSSFGTQAELMDMISAYKAKGVGFIADVVVNHKCGKSAWCDFPNETATGNGKTWTINWSDGTEKNCCQFICSNDEAFSDSKSSAYNKGYITGATDTGENSTAGRDLDHNNTTVQQNIKIYLDYLYNYIGYTGFRYDMCKGYSGNFVGIYNESVSGLKFSVGEYWDGNSKIRNWIEATKNDGSDIQSAAFDFQFKYRMNGAFGSNDLSKLDSQEALISDSYYNGGYKRYAVTFCDNHDTGRDDNKLTNNWSAANAYMLASPGTPCVWIKHYKADSLSINHMILARKAAGLTNTGTQVIEHSNSNGGYIYRTKGTNGEVYVQFGNAVNNGTPAGFKLIAKGDDYRFYCTSSLNVPEYTEPGPGPEPEVYTPYLDSADETSVFFETSQEYAPYIWVWDATTNYTGGKWPGQQMTKMGQTSTGNYIYKWKYDGTLTTTPTGLIFSKSSAGDKFFDADLVFKNHGYYTESSKTPTKTITQVGKTEGIESVCTDAKVASMGTFNLAGQRVGNNAKGIVIKNGKKVIK